MLTTVLLVLALASVFMALVGTPLLNWILQPKSDETANYIKLPLLMIVKIALPWSAWLSAIVFGVLWLISRAS